MKKVYVFLGAILIMGSISAQSLTGELTEKKKKSTRATSIKKQTIKPLKMVKNSRIIPKEMSLAPKELLPIINKKK